MSIWDVFGCGENGMSCIKYMVELGDEKYKIYDVAENFPSIDSMCWLMRRCIIFENESWKCI